MPGEGQKSTLWSFIKPYNPAFSSIISGWIKNVLKNAGIDTGLSVTDILEVLRVMLQPCNGFITDRLAHLQKNIENKVLSQKLWTGKEEWTRVW